MCVLSLCVILCGCWVQNENKCIDNTCWNDVTAEDRTTNKTTSEVEGEIAGFAENSGEIPIAEKTDWELITVEWEQIDF